jgi:hypothetical protein
VLLIGSKKTKIKAARIFSTPLKNSAALAGGWGNSGIIIFETGSFHSGILL